MAANTVCLHRDARWSAFAWMDQSRRISTVRGYVHVRARHSEVQRLNVGFAWLLIAGCEQDATLDQYYESVCGVFPGREQDL